ncbi:MAG: helix-turn-helix transcriptional regulator [Clostridia bacterium]|nr:helix-turn-helix transcriptional regulator [Clostridia bacterium]
MEMFAERLKELRTERGLKQRDLAAALQTTDDSVYSWEKGRSQPSIEMILKICIYFEVSADYLLGLENEVCEKLY